MVAGLLNLCMNAVPAAELLNSTHTKTALPLLPRSSFYQRIDSAFLRGFHHITFRDDRGKAGARLGMVGDRETYVRFKDVKKTYDGQSLVIKNLNLEIRRGEFLTLLGPSGSGKTSCLMMLAG